MAWIKKTSNEKKIKSKHPPGPALVLLSIIIFTVSCVFKKWGLPTDVDPAFREPLTWPELFEEMPYLLLFSVFVSAIAVLLNRKLCNKKDH